MEEESQKSREIAIDGRQEVQSVGIIAAVKGNVEEAERASVGAGGRGGCKYRLRKVRTS